MSINGLWKDEGRVLVKWSHLFLSLQVLQLISSMYTVIKGTMWGQQGSGSSCLEYLQGSQPGWTKNRCFSLQECSNRDVLPEVTAPVDEWRRDEHERKSEKRWQAEVELQIVPHILQRTLRQKGGAATFFRLPVRCAIRSLLVLLRCLEKRRKRWVSKEVCQQSKETPLNIYQIQHVTQRSLRHLEPQDLAPQAVREHSST